MMIGDQICFQVHCSFLSLLFVERGDILLGDWVMGGHQRQGGNSRHVLQPITQQGGGAKSGSTEEGDDYPPT